MITSDPAVTASGWSEVLGAVATSEDRLAAWGCVRMRYQIGDGWIDFLLPDGDGCVAQSLARRGGAAHLWAAVAATADIDALLEHLRSSRVPVEREGEDLLVCGEAPFGLPVLVESDSSPESVGLVDHLYEVTNLVPSAAEVADHYATAFGLDDNHFVPIESTNYGYAGTLTLFREGQLDRFEVVTPHEPAKTMARYFAKHGPCLYMAFAESDRLDEIAERAGPERSTAAHDDEGIHTLFVHPPVLGGMMLGLSRPGYAWTWSGGYPDA